MLLLSSCWKWPLTNIDPSTPNKVYGNKVIYMPVSAARQISYSPLAVSVVNPGKIYVKDNFIYQVEQGKGIHIIDNTVPSSAGRIGFISIYGCTEISILGNYLYTNNLDELVVIDIRNLSNVNVVKRTKTFPGGLYDYYQAQNPPSRGYYECPRADSGVVAGWRKDSLITGCYY
jgi:hypothetical protein